MKSLSDLHLAMQKGPYGLAIAVQPESVEVAGNADLDHWQLVDATGTAVADLHGKILAGHMGEGLSMDGATIRCNRALPTPGDLERHVVDGLHGNWILITRKPLPRRLYTDFGCSLALVYSPDLQRAGSSALHVLGEARFEADLNHGRVERLVRAEGEHGWIAGTLTAHNGLWRLLPNHYLDLESFTAHRYWPRDDFAFGMDFEEAAQICAQDIRGFVEAAAQQYRLGLSLTAGYDSRIVLSGGARVPPERLHPYTFRVPGLSVDTVTAPELCRRLGLSHEFLEILFSDEAGKAWWDRMVGYSVREVNRNTFPTLLGVKADLTLSGIYGETGRIYLYRKDAAIINSQPVNLESLLRRMALPRDPELLENLAGWIKPLMHLPSSVILDLAYVELRVGSWAVGQSPAQKAFSSVMMPLAQRRVQAAMIAVDPVRRGNGPLFHRIGTINWPEAMEIPINRFGDHRDFLVKVGAVRTLEKVRRLVRKRLG